MTGLTLGRTLRVGALAVLGAFLGSASAQVFGTPQQAYTTQTSYPTANEMGHGDFNGDGGIDLVLAAVNVNANQPLGVRILLNQNNGTFAEAPDSFFEGGRPGMVHPRETVIEDFNRDGRDDIFIADHGFDQPPFPGYHSMLLLSRTDGRMQNANANIPSFDAFTHSVAAGDIDSDGDIDIFYNQQAPQEGKDAAFLLNNGEGVFTRTTVSAMLSSTPSLSAELVDVSGDKIIDLVQGSGNGQTPGPPPRNGYGYIRKGNGDGTFGPELYGAFPERPLGFSSNMFDMKPLDFDGDGDLDFFGTGVNQDGFSGRYIQALRNDGTGVFSDATAQLIPPGFNSASSTDWIIYLNLADVTGDCQPDIVPGDKGAISYLGRSGTAYTDLQPINTVGMSPIEVFDFDGNGWPDVVRGAGTDFWYTPNNSPGGAGCRGGLVSAMAPLTRTVSVGEFATGFFAVINGSSVAAQRCRLIQSSPPARHVETKFFYRETNPATNLPVGSPLQRFDIPPGGTKTFVFAMAPQEAGLSRFVDIMIECLNGMISPDISPNINRMMLTGATGAAADIIPIAVTLSGDGVVRVPGANGAQVFTAAAVNVRDGEQLTIRARYTGSETISTFVCETDQTGACSSVLVPELTMFFPANQPKTFTILVEPRGVSLPADFANRRIALEFGSRGRASVAVTTQ